MSKNRWKNDDIFTTLNKSDFEDDTVDQDDLLLDDNKLLFIGLLILIVVLIIYIDIINTTENIIYW